MRSPLSAVCIAVVLAITPATLAQTFTVDANDPSADYQSLDLAVQSVPSGSTLLLRSDFAENGGNIQYTLDRDLTLLGDGPDGNRVTVFGEMWLSGPDDMEVLSSKVNWDSSRSLNIGTLVPFSIRSFLQVEDCVVTTGTEWGIPSRGPAFEGVQILKNCVLVGGEPSFPVIEQSADGMLILQGCTVVHTDGSGESAVFIENGIAYWTDCQFVGEVNGTIEETLATLALDPDGLRLGQRASLTATGTPFGPSFLFTALGFPAEPVDTSAGPYFLHSSAPWITRVSYDASGQWTLESDLPTDPALAGIQLTFQSWDLVANLLSGLEAGIIDL